MRILEIPKSVAAAIVTFRADCPRRHTHTHPHSAVAGACRERRRKSPRKQNTHTQTNIYTVGCGSKRYYNYTDVVVCCVCQASIEKNYFGCIYYYYYYCCRLLQYVYDTIYIYIIFGFGKRVEKKKLNDRLDYIISTIFYTRPIIYTYTYGQTIHPMCPVYLLSLYI